MAAFGRIGTGGKPFHAKSKASNVFDNKDMTNPSALHAELLRRKKKPVDAVPGKMFGAKDPGAGGKGDNC